MYKELDVWGVLIGSYKHDTEKELKLLNGTQKEFVCKYFKESYDVLNISQKIQLKGDDELKESPKIYIIAKITDHNGNDKKEGRYPLRIGRRCAFGLGEPSINIKMAICYRPRQNEDYAGTLHTSIVQKVTHNQNELIVKTQNSIYHFQEEKL